jgi:rare lipoprotein A
MKSLANLSLLLLAGAAPATAQEPPAGDGPRGSSELRAGETRYDVVGHAAVGELAGVSAASTVLPSGSFAEITALDTGRTIIVAITGDAVLPRHVATLSRGAAAALRVPGDSVAVRVRKVVPTPQDVVLLREGQAASFRADAPPALLVALRKMLAPLPVATTAKLPRPLATPVPRSAPPPVAKPSVVPAPARQATSGYVLQVAALSSAARAAQVATAVGGTIVAGPPVWRVRLGPYPDTATATRAKAEAARRGYPGGQITRIP